MRVPRCYFPVELTPGAQLELPVDMSHHLTHVLRMRADQALILFNGRGGEYTARLTRVGRKGALAQVDAWQDVSRESRLHITLAQSISRSQKMDYTVQKAVELGVTRIVPLISRRTGTQLPAGRMEKKRTHWQKIIIAACEQSGRTVLPELETVMHFDDWLAQDKNPVRCVLDPGAGAGFPDCRKDANEVSLLIGSEGGWDEQELSAARDAGYTGISLGRRILRTETAAVVSVAICQSLWGDLYQQLQATSY
ncbi:MAG: 16S rRNA (uracil(1498)-N(3))-methyltransferase [Thiotrichales bacterium]|nr:16S rRNA (uracil(1498)-N(3))-methyltransferase [Thiotrichales bacterium]